MSSVHLVTFQLEKIKRQGKNDCLVCHRLREASRRLAAGVRPRLLGEGFPCGHSRSKDTRANRNDCAECHRLKESKRYASDPLRYRDVVFKRTQRYRALDPQKYEARRV
jgi:nitrate reductase cytochrome c-type subunit